ncbi:hypothetical protein U1Q18_024772 [Sarracenia purpurea var. burkii]
MITGSSSPFDFRSGLVIRIVDANLRHPPSRISPSTVSISGSSSPMITGSSSPFDFRSGSSSPFAAADVFSVFLISDPKIIVRPWSF